MTTRTVGVVVPVLNGGDVLGSALDSLLAQDRPPDRILVIDGGSTDDTVEVARRRGIEIVQQRGVGLAGARNDGISLVDTDVVAFLDADDTWTHDSLGVRLDALDATGADAVVGAVRTVSLDDRAVPERHRDTLGVEKTGWTPGALAVRRSVFDVVGDFDEALTIGADSDWLVRLRQSTVQVAEVQHCVLLKGVRDDSLSVDTERYGRELLHVAWQFLRRRGVGGATTVEARTRPRASLEIVHVLPRFIGGGPERSVLVLADEAASLGRDVGHTAAVLDAPMSPGMVARARAIDMDVVEITTTGMLRDLAADADLVLVHFWNHPTLLEVLERNEFDGRPVALWSHVLGTRPPQILSESVALGADALLVSSAASRESDGARAAESEGVSVHVVAGMIDRRRLEGTQRREPEPGRDVVVGYLGSLDPTKMHPRLPEMCARVSDARVHFLFVGDGDGDELRRRLRDVGLGDRATVEPRTENVRDVFSRMDVFGYALAPTSYATTDRTLQEAMWVGLPVVVLEGGGISGMVEHERNGLVVNEADWAPAIERVALDTPLARRLGDGASARSRQEFDPTRATEHCLELLSRCASSPRPERRHVPTRSGGSARFLASLGSHAGLLPTADDLQRRCAEPTADLTSAEAWLAGCPDTFGRGEGGVAHYRNQWPEDPLLRYWSALVARGRGDSDVADAEMAAAAGLLRGSDRL